MLNDTITPEQKQTLLAAIPKIEQAGGPKWYPWCELFKHKMPYGPQDWVEELRIWSIDGCDAIYCPPAVAAAVIAWAHELIDYLHSKYYAHSFLQPTRWSMHAVDRDGMLVCEASGESVNKLAASVAIISAVAEGLEEG